MVIEPRNVTPIKAKNAGPSAVFENACTELITPVRVMKVPKSECKKAVPVSQGINIAFSTGSQPQKPPQPSTSYAQRPPRIKPIERNIQANSVQRRVVTIHSSFLD